MKVGKQEFNEKVNSMRTEISDMLIPLGYFYYETDNCRHDTHYVLVRPISPIVFHKIDFIVSSYWHVVSTHKLAVETYFNVGIGADYTRTFYGRNLSYITSDRGVNYRRSVYFFGRMSIAKVNKIYLKMIKDIHIGLEWIESYNTPENCFKMLNSMPCDMKADRHKIYAEEYSLLKTVLSERDQGQI
jgi:hypothetical protein